MPPADGSLGSPSFGTGLDRFDAEVLSQLKPLLDRLLAAPRFPRAEHPRGTIPTGAGVYLFSGANGRAVYVGQSRRVRTRLAEHCLQSSGENSASLAFNIAKNNAKKANIVVEGTRKQVAANADFVEHFVAAKDLVGTMFVQFAVEEHAGLRSVFEVYATYALDTHEYNTFETH